MFQKVYVELQILGGSEDIWHCITVGHIVRVARGGSGSNQECGH